MGCDSQFDDWTPPPTAEEQARIDAREAALKALTDRGWTKVTYLSGSYSQYDIKLWKCPVDKVLVTKDDIFAHDAWHESLLASTAMLNRIG